MQRMEAETINCPMCGAATSTDAPQCQYCEARLATISCPSCFGLMFLGSRHCPKCGAVAQRRESLEGSNKQCPRCKLTMTTLTLKDAEVLECERCMGLWVDPPTFERICADREQQSAVLGKASMQPPDLAAKVSYIPCPDCAQLMNRVNFARCSGVIVDLCKKHGIWFDRDELSGIVEFIRSGGLELSRTREKNALEEERRRLQQERLMSDISEHSVGPPHTADEKFLGISSAKDLLRILFD
ncbi:MAG TPA: zf-TFIIB domain-containing protein [Pyrinomonadaceae bacterium]|nr:zf-TFIIB domain-containing protein [Pyrinomonadaceae bacterium]